MTTKDDLIQQKFYGQNDEFSTGVTIVSRKIEHYLYVSKWIYDVTEMIWKNSKEMMFVSQQEKTYQLRK